MDTSRAFITTSVQKWSGGIEFNYAIFTTVDDLVGAIGLMTGMGPGVLEVGYWTRTPLAGRGYMSAAVKAVALTLPGIDRIAIRHDAANAASDIVHSSECPQQTEVVSSSGLSGEEWAEDLSHRGLTG